MPDVETKPDSVWAAEEAKLRAEAEAASALAAKTKAEASEAKAKAVKARLDADREREKRKKELAANEHHHFFMFSTSVSDSSVKACVDQLTLWDRDDPTCDIEICFNSPGGSVVDGMALYDVIQQLKTTHQITTSARGYAASMAGILLQAGHRRVMGREAYLMIHEASFGTSGKMGDVEDTVEWVKMVEKRILRIFAERSTLSANQLSARWRRKDWWIDSDHALELGLIDEVR